jgi:hypothetical protein
MKRSHFTTPRTLADAEFPVGYPTAKPNYLELTPWWALAIGAVFGALAMLIVARFI